MELVKKKNRSGTASLLLDYTVNNLRKKQYLGKNFILTKNQTKEEQKEIIRLANKIMIKRMLEISSNDHGFVPEHKKRVNFNLFCENFLDSYKNQDKDIYVAAFKQFKLFTQNDIILCNQITKDNMEGFKEFLIRKYKGFTPWHYFGKIKSILNDAVEKEILLKNPCDKIKKPNPNAGELRKDVLWMNEIETLANTKCNNENYKRAFLFGCLTGLRFGDLKQLEWKHVFLNDNVNGLILNYISFSQKKLLHHTSKKHIIPLNEDAVELLGKKCLGPIFKLPKYVGYFNKTLKKWVEKAKIKKHITSHCARHSLGTNLYFHTKNPLAVSKNLGHSTTKMSEKYIHIVETMQQEASNMLPSINYNDKLAL
jgi:integrase/recombinase XerD